VRAWTSTSSGRVPSSVETTAAPLTPSARSPRNSSDGLSTASSPSTVMRNTPISSTPPNRFLWPAGPGGPGSAPLEVEDGVHDVLERPRAGHRPALGHVTHQEDRRARFLGEALEPGRALPHLAHVAGRAVELVGVRRLDRVDHQHRRLHLPRRARIAPAPSLPGIRRHRRPRPGGPPASGPAPPTPHPTRRACVPPPFQPRRHLQQHGALADPRLAAQEDERPGDHAAAQDEVQLPDAPSTSAPWRAARTRSAGPGAAGALGPPATHGPPRRTAGPSRPGLLDEGIPLAARRALALPARGLVAALGAEEGGPFGRTEAGGSGRHGCRSRDRRHFATGRSSRA
jgi:hypothetical protein